MKNGERKQLKREQQQIMNRIISTFAHIDTRTQNKTDSRHKLLCDHTAVKDVTSIKMWQIAACEKKTHAQMNHFHKTVVFHSIWFFSHSLRTLVTCVKSMGEKCEQIEKNLFNH